MYELHLTIHPISAKDLSEFVRLCESIGGKALIVELAHGQHRVQPMLTVTRDCRPDDLSPLVDMLTAQMSAHGYDAIRCKVEVETDEAGGDMESVAYLEWHGRIVVGEGDVVDLQALCAAHDGHLSRNALHSTNQRYITIRAADHAALVGKVSRLLAAMSRDRVTVDKQRWEGVVRDTNLGLDRGWLE